MSLSPGRMGGRDAEIVASVAIGQPVAAVACRLLNLLEPRSNGTHSAGQFCLGYQPAPEHRMDQCEEFPFRRRNVAIDYLSKLVLSSATIKGGKRPADRETLVNFRSDLFSRVGPDW